MYYTTNEIAALLRVTPRTIYNWIYSGKLPAIKVGKSYRIPKEAVDQLLQPHKKQ